MYLSANDLKAFYNKKMGRVVRRIIKKQIQDFWPSCPKTFSVAGIGYTTPYLRQFVEMTDKVMGIAPIEQGCYHWPKEGDNRICVAHECELPFPAESMDRVLVAHALEFTAHPNTMLKEIWRVLKPQGRALFIVPNRNSFWSQAEWSAFGHGRPYTLRQLCQTLHHSQFVTERMEEVLFMPPIQRAFIMKSAGIFETIGQSVLPVAAGLHMVEVSKQVYAPVDKGSGTLQRIREGVKIAKPVMSNRT